MAVREAREAAWRRRAAEKNRAWSVVVAAVDCRSARRHSEQDGQK